MYANVQVKIADDARGDKGSPRNCSYLKSCESFYTCSHAPPFYRETKGLLHSDNTLNSKNISGVNTHTNVFYISYIHKPATSSHTKPGLFETTTLTLLLASSWISPFRKSSRTVTPELVLHHIPEFHRFPKFVAPQVHGFESSRIRDFEASQVQDSEPTRVRDSEASRVRDSWPSRICDSETSWVPDSRSSWFLWPWKHISRISWTSTFRGWQVFLNSRTTLGRVCDSLHNLDLITTSANNALRRSQRKKMFNPGITSTRGFRNYQTTFGVTRQTSFTKKLLVQCHTLKFPISGCE
jgi:hypothetical protein